MIKWIMASVSSTSFSIAVNDDLHGFFQGKRGLRQGDPMSPYLFTLVMEVLTLMLKRNVEEAESFKYHPKCGNLKMINLCFADDLIMFSHGNKDSVLVLTKALYEFRCVSGLVSSIAKSTVFFANVSDMVKKTILDFLPFEEGFLPMKYLGVPLISTRLFYKDCKVLVEKVKNRLGDWRNKSLSSAGRLQLVISVLSSMHVFWSSVFILPISISKEIEKLLRGFLWCQGDLKHGKAKVSWKCICLPKEEGGLGLRRLDVWNMTLMSKHIWNIITHKESLWFRWIHSYHLSGRNFWEVQIKANASWGWRKLLLLRDKVKLHFLYKIGNGKNTSAWFDFWNACGPLNFISNRDITRAGFNRTSLVADMVGVNSWVWPDKWFIKYPQLCQVLVPSIQRNKNDHIVWKGSDGKELKIF